jgi:hypothetical protein
MPRAEDIQWDEKISILLKAPYGFGKTIAAVSMAMEGPVWLAYWDKKVPIEVLTYYRAKYPQVLKNLEYDVYGAHNATQFLNKLINLTRRCDYYGLVNDSVTNMTSAAVNWSLGFRNPKGPKIDSLNPAAFQLVPDFEEYKIETSLVTQSLDICRTLPCHVIWTCHPLPSLKVEGAGKSISVSKVNNIVTYGSKVGAIIPGQFTEIYHMSFSQDWDNDKGIYVNKRTVNTKGIGDDFAKTALGLPDSFDITDKLFWQEWQAAVKKSLGGE